MENRTTFSTAGGVATVTLNRPEKRNALDARMVQELHDAVVRANAMPDVRVIVFTGAGPAFCAGADLAYLQDISRNDILENQRDSKALMGLMHAIYTSAKPTVARVHGPALAGGCGLATVCDITVASTEATFGYPEVRIGFIPAIVMVFLRYRVGDAVAKDLVLRGTAVSADEARRVGLIAHVVAPDALDARVTEIVGDLLKGGSAAQALAKQMFATLPGMSMDAGLEYAAGMNAIARQTEECRAGIAKFLSRTS